MTQYILFIIVGFVAAGLIGKLQFRTPVLIILSFTFGWAVIGALGIFAKVEFIRANSLICWLVISALFIPIFKFTPLEILAYFLTKEKAQSHGSAEWADKQTAKRYDKGFPLGRMGKSIFRVLSHLVICAPTRSGKGIGSIIPTLLEHIGSIVCLDVKGENYAVTYRQREALGNRVHLIDPFGLTSGKKSRFNWLDTIDVKNPDCIGQAASLSDMIVAHDKAPSDPHFEESAKALIQGLILLAAADPDKSQRNMVTVRKILMLPDSQFLALMNGCIGHPAAFDVISRCASKMVGTPEKERGSIISTAQRHTAFLDDPRLAETLSGSDFDISQIKEENISIFLVMAPDRLRAYRSFVRAFYGIAISAITATQTKSKDGVILQFDEFNQLGYMPAVEDAISLLAGYNAWIHAYVQDLSQLKGMYAKWQTFLANSTRLFFGCNDYDTAKYVSDTLGQFTETIAKEETGGAADSRISRNLLNPDEVMRLPKSSVIALLQGEAPALLNRLTYYEDKEYQGLFDPNPFHA